MTTNREKTVRVTVQPEVKDQSLNDAGHLHSEMKKQLDVANEKKPDIGKYQPGEKS